MRTSYSLSRENCATISRAVLAKLLATATVT
jgi:hypothetical protein